MHRNRVPRRFEKRRIDLVCLNSKHAFPCEWLSDTPLPGPCLRVIRTKICKLTNCMHRFVGAVPSRLKSPNFYLCCTQYMHLYSHRLRRLLFTRILRKIAWGKNEWYTVYMQSIISQIRTLKINRLCCLHMHNQICKCINKTPKHSNRQRRPR